MKKRIILSLIPLTIMAPILSFTSTSCASKINETDKMLDLYANNYQKSGSGAIKTDAEYFTE
jgi:hypothetical protein